MAGLLADVLLLNPEDFFQRLGGEHVPCPALQGFVVGGTHDEGFRGFVHWTKARGQQVSQHLLPSLVSYPLCPLHHLGVLRFVKFFIPLFLGVVKRAVVVDKVHVFQVLRWVAFQCHQPADGVAVGVYAQSNYIRTDRIAKNILWEHESPYGNLEIIINLSKPKKDPRDIAA